MNNREKYIKASSIIEPSADFASRVLKEAEKMSNNKSKEYRHVHFRRRGLVSIAAALVLVFALSAAAYASDIGGFKGTIDSWLYGKAVKVQVEQMEEGGVLLTYPDGSQRSTGGVAHEANGDMRPLTTEEILADLSNEIEVEENDKGRIMFYYRDHAVDITDQIDENGIVKLKFKDGVLPTYITLKWKGDGSYVADFGTFGYKEIEESE